MNALLTALDRLGCPRTLVIGDVMLDHYLLGQVERISPEGPQPILRVETDEFRLGGAASVARLGTELGAQVSLAGLVGEDPQAQTVRHLCASYGIDDRLLVASNDVMTTTKERCLGRVGTGSFQPLLRIDRERLRPVTSTQLLDILVGGVLERLSSFDVVLISDYSKGTCALPLLRPTIANCRKLGIPVLVDPGRHSSSGDYQGATLIKPNRRELSNIVGRSIVTIPDAISAAAELTGAHGIEAAVITLDRDGMVAGTPAGGWEHFPARRRDVADVTGAGDMALAALGISLASGLSLSQAVSLANLAAGLEVERVGVTPISCSDLRREILSHRYSRKIMTLPEIMQYVTSERVLGKSIVFTNGCFDLLHVGHVSYLQEASRLGDRLVVAVNSDTSVRRLKGPERPVILATERVQMLAALECVDAIIVFDDETPLPLLRELRPDILVKGGQYTRQQVVGSDYVESYGGSVQLVQHVDGISSTKIIHSVRSSTSVHL